MSSLNRVRLIGLGLYPGAKAVWAWHHRQMRTDGRYARTVIDGLARAAWQDSPERFVLASSRVAVDLARLVGETKLRDVSRRKS